MRPQGWPAVRVRLTRTKAGRRRLTVTVEWDTPLIGPSGLISIVTLVVSVGTLAAGVHGVPTVFELT